MAALWEHVWWIKGNIIIFSYVVVGIQHTGDVLSQVSVQNSLNVAADIDCRGQKNTCFCHFSFESTTDSVISFQTRTVFEVEIAGCLRRPQPHGVDNIVPVAGDGCVVWQSKHHLPVHDRKQKYLNVSSQRKKTKTFYYHTHAYLFWIIFSPECQPIWRHQGDARSCHRSALDACIRDGPSPRGYQNAANHQPPQPERWHPVILQRGIENMCIIVTLSGVLDCFLITFSKYGSFKMMKLSLYDSQWSVSSLNDELWRWSFFFISIYIEKWKITFWLIASPSLCLKKQQLQKATLKKQHLTCWRVHTVHL